jgi:hypothetical protein
MIFAGKATVLLKIIWKAKTTDMIESNDGETVMLYQVS